MQVASTTPTCAKGHLFWTARSSVPSAVLGEPSRHPCHRPSRQRTVPQQDPSITRRQTLRPVVIGAVVALIVVVVLMFTTPHATYNGNVNDGGAVVQGSITTSCISAWDNMVGNFNHPTVPSGMYAQYNQNAANASCTGVVHGRQHLAILLLIVAAGSGVGATLRFRAVRRRT